jgi:hypothetical protein
VGLDFLAYLIDLKQFEKYSGAPKGAFACFRAIGVVLFFPQILCGLVGYTIDRWRGLGCRDASFSSPLALYNSPLGYV